MEICIAMFVLAAVFGGLIESLVVVRRTAEIAIHQNAAVDAAQSCLEQLRVALWSFNAQNFPYSPATGSTSVTLRQLNGTSTPGNWTLNISPGTPPDLTSVPAGTAPTGGVLNQITVPLALEEGNNTAARSLTLNMWVWLQNRSVPANAQYGQTCGITIIYSWQYREGSKTRNFIRELKTMTSSIRSI